ncbi:accessory gene regulator ArgB-like protein [Ruminococcus flavefaciens]|uniref:accessory gene regulator ArgB-like protein n=1 Tax=Ruminococcus flavefaciens TaxID=1265 RepID=UPI0034E9461F
MIHRLSLELADYLFYKKIITMEKYEVYSYGLEMLISAVIGALLILACGILTNSLVRSIIFYVLFVFIRMYTGGYHADSHLVCKATLLCSFILTNIAYLMLRDRCEMMFLVVIGILNFIIVLLLSPVECAKKPLSEYVRKRNKVISCCLYIFIFTLSLVLCYMSYNEEALFPTLVVSNISLLMYIGIIKERRRSHES